MSKRELLYTISARAYYGGPITGTTVWETDGTPSGTVALGTSSDIGQQAASTGTVPDYAVLRNRTVFANTDGTGAAGLWVSDGTLAGTARLAAVQAANLGPLGDGRALFAGTDGTAGSELWIADGTAAGTARLADIAPGAAGSAPGRAVALGGGRAVFAAATAATGRELWVTDGTAAGTSQLSDVNPGAASSNPASLTALGNGRALFTVTDSDGNTEVWGTNGTNAGTRVLVGDHYNLTSLVSSFAMLRPGVGVFTGGHFEQVGSTLTNGGQWVWTTDGNSAQAVLNVTSFDNRASGMTALGNGRAVFEVFDYNLTTQIWVTDGTAAGTAKIGQVTSKTYDPASAPVALGNGSAVFAADDGADGMELWVTDGTAAGTHLLTDINPGVTYNPYNTDPYQPNASNPRSFVASGNGTVQFLADAGGGRTQLWTTDGTAAGTAALADVSGTSTIAYVAAVDVEPVPTIAGIRPDTGASASDGITRTGAVTAFGTADPGSTVVLYDGATVAGSGTADGSGAFSVAVSPPLAAGRHALTARATDAAGVRSAPSAEYAAVVRPSVRNDVDGDGRGDLVWQDASGAPSVWAMQGGSVGAYLNYANPGSAWRVAGTADLDGDGRADLLWQDAGGTPSAWLAGSGGGVSAYAQLANPGADWRLVGGGDIDGNGRADLLWQRGDGAVSAWLMDGTAVTGYANFANPGASWRLVGAGDLDGDGRADLVWQDANGAVSAWLMGGSAGAPTVSAYANFSNPGADWRLAALGDLNGDGRDDLVFQNRDGTPSAWLLGQGGAGGGIGVSAYPVFSNPGTAWRLADTTDANGDGRDDLVWQNDSGQPSLWIMGAGGTSVDGFPVLANPGASWHVV